MAMVPVKAAMLREVLVLRARVRVVTHKHVDVFLVIPRPVRVDVPYYRRGKDKVAPVEVVVVVVGVAKVGAIAAGGVCC